MAGCCSQRIHRRLRDVRRVAGGAWAPVSSTKGHHEGHPALGDFVEAYCLEAYAELAAARQDWERSARLLRAGAALFESLNVPIGDQERESYDITVDGKLKLAGSND